MNTLQKLVLGTSAVSLMLVLNARKGMTPRGKSIAVATGVVSADELATHSPDILVPDLRGLSLEMLLG